MLGQVDLNGHLAALLIGQVLDSGHGFVFLPAMASANATPRRSRADLTPVG
jgi:hypothetical protein